MRNPFEMTGTCREISFAIDIDDFLPEDFPFCTVPTFADPTAVPREPEIVVPDVMVPDICRCITFELGSTFEIVENDGTAWLSLIRSTDNCCELGYSLFLGVEIPCLPRNVTVEASLNLDIGDTEPYLRVDFNRSAVDTCALALSIELGLDLLTCAEFTVEGSGIVITAGEPKFDFNLGFNEDCELQFNYSIVFPDCDALGLTAIKGGYTGTQALTRFTVPGGSTWTQAPKELCTNYVGSQGTHIYSCIPVLTREFTPDLDPKVTSIETVKGDFFLAMGFNEDCALEFAYSIVFPIFDFSCGDLGLSVQKYALSQSPEYTWADDGHGGIITVPVMTTPPGGLPQTVYDPVLVPTTDVGGVTFGDPTFMLTIGFADCELFFAYSLVLPDCESLGLTVPPMTGVHSTSLVTGKGAFALSLGFNADCELSLNYDIVFPLIDCESLGLTAGKRKLTENADWTWALDGEGFPYSSPIMTTPIIQPGGPWGEPVYGPEETVYLPTMEPTTDVGGVTFGDPTFMLTMKFEDCELIFAYSLVFPCGFSIIKNAVVVEQGIEPTFNLSMVFNDDCELELNYSIVFPEPPCTLFSIVKEVIKRNQPTFNVTHKFNSNCELELDFEIGFPSMPTCTMFSIVQIGVVTEGPDPMFNLDLKFNEECELELNYSIVFPVLELPCTMFSIDIFGVVNSEIADEGHFYFNMGFNTACELQVEYDVLFPLIEIPPPPPPMRLEIVPAVALIGCEALPVFNRVITPLGLNNIRVDLDLKIPHCPCVELTFDAEIEWLPTGTPATVEAGAFKMPDAECEWQLAFVLGLPRPALPSKVCSVGLDIDAGIEMVYRDYEPQFLAGVIPTGSCDYKISLLLQLPSARPYSGGYLIDDVYMNDGAYIIDHAKEASGVVFLNGMVSHYEYALTADLVNGYIVLEYDAHAHAVVGGHLGPAQDFNYGDAGAVDLCALGEACNWVSMGEVKFGGFTAGRLIDIIDPGPELPLRIDHECSQFMDGAIGLRRYQFIAADGHLRVYEGVSGLDLECGHVKDGADVSPVEIADILLGGEGACAAQAGAYISVGLACSIIHECDGLRDNGLPIHDYELVHVGGGIVRLMQSGVNQEFLCGHAASYAPDLAVVAAGELNICQIGRDCGFISIGDVPGGACAVVPGSYITVGQDCTIAHDCDGLSDTPINELYIAGFAVEGHRLKLNGFEYVHDFECGHKQEWQPGAGREMGWSVDLCPLVSNCLEGMLVLSCGNLHKGNLITISNDGSGCLIEHACGEGNGAFADQVFGPFLYDKIALGLDGNFLQLNGQDIRMLYECGHYVPSPHAPGDWSTQIDLCPIVSNCIADRNLISCGDLVPGSLIKLGLDCTIKHDCDGMAEGALAIYDTVNIQRVGNAIQVEVHYKNFNLDCGHLQEAGSSGGANDSFDICEIGADCNFVSGGDIVDLISCGDLVGGNLITVSPGCEIAHDCDNFYNDATPYGVYEEHHALRVSAGVLIDQQYARGFAVECGHLELLADGTPYDSPIVDINALIADYMAAHYALVELSVCGGVVTVLTPV